MMKRKLSGRMIVLVSAACFAPFAMAQLLSKSAQDAIAKANEAKWERLTVKNESGTVAYVVVERTPFTIETHTCPKDAPRRACEPGKPISSKVYGQTTTDKKTLALGQSYTDNFAVDNTKIVYSVYADLLDGGGYCAEKKLLDGSAKGMSYKLTGTASKSLFKCNEAAE